MGILEQMKTDFADVLAEDVADALTIRGARVPAVVSETTFSSDVMPAGIRPRRTFSATCLAEALAAAPPEPGDLLLYRGKEFRIRNVKDGAGSPLAVIEFSEK